MATEVILLKEPYEVSFTGNPVNFIFAVTPYREVEKTQNIKINIAVLVENIFKSDEFTEVRNESFFPDELGKIDIDIRTILDAYLQYYLPNHKLKAPAIANGQFKRFKLRYNLSKDDVLIGEVSGTTIYHAIKGGLSKEEWHPENFFTDFILTGKKPLLLYPPKSKIFADDPLFIYWIYPYDDAREQQVFFSATLDNISGEFSSPVYESLTAGKWSVCCAPIGWAQLNLQSYAAPYNAIKYTAQVINPDDSRAIVDPIEFTFDYRNFADTKTLLYRNSLGGLQTVRLRGTIDLEADYSRQLSSKTIPPSWYSNLNIAAETTQNRAEETAKYKGDTGFYTREQLNYFRDLFISDEVYEYKNDKLLPVVINKNNTRFYSNKENLVSITIEWQSAYINNYFSPDKLTTLSNTCPAVKKLVVKQINKNLLQILYNLQQPYDLAECEITIGVTTTNFFYKGNTGIVYQQIDNPYTDSDPHSITVKLRTICDQFSDPVNAGAWTTQTVYIIGDSLPVANDDYFEINSGFNTAVTLSPSALENDYDPDGDAIEVIAASGSTHMGGTYSIAADGTVQYTPPASGFTGQDYFDYTIRNTAVPANTANARCYINVGGIISIVFAKIVKRNAVVSETEKKYSEDAEIWIDFFSNPAATNPLDVTGRGIIVNYHYHYSGFVNDTEDTVYNDEDKTIDATGTKVLIFEGNIIKKDKLPFFGWFIVKKVFTLLPGTGYTPV